MRDKLIKSADRIIRPSVESIENYRELRETAVIKVNKAMELRADIYELIGGEKNISMMRDNHGNHTRFIYSILNEFDSEVLVDTIIWVFRAYRSRGFHTNYWAAQLNTWIDILKNLTDEKTYSEILPIYEWMLVKIPDFTLISDKQIVW